MKNFIISICLCCLGLFCIWRWTKTRRKMKAIIRTFQAGMGDCIFFLLDDGEVRKATMIDCGKYTDDIRQYVENELGKHIDILVVTHIDNDHVDGIVEMLEQTPDLRIDKILYNCNQLWDGQQKEQASEVLQKDMQILRANLPARQKSENGKIKADKAVTLAEKIAGNDAWWQAWIKNEYITKDTKPIPLDEYNDRFGQFTVLTPTKAEIEKLNKNFRVEYSRLTKHIIDAGGNVEGKETLFELVARVVAMKRTNYEVMEPMKAGTINILDETRLQEAFEFEPQKVTDENEASIALMWECHNKKVLFMGDAEPDEVAESIKEMFGEGLHEAEAIKVSHHGSKHSTSKLLTERVDSSHYFFTGGNMKDKPSLAAVMKITKRGDSRNRILHFNNTENAIVKALVSEQGNDVRNQYHIEIAERNEYQFEY